MVMASFLLCSRCIGNLIFVIVSITAAVTSTVYRSGLRKNRSVDAIGLIHESQRYQSGTQVAYSMFLVDVLIQQSNASIWNRNPER
jgi:hypothetical protein